MSGLAGVEMYISSNGVIGVVEVREVRGTVL